MNDINLDAIRARANRALSSFPTGAFRTPLHDQLRAALADVPELLAEVDNLTRGQEHLAAQRDAAEAQVRAVERAISGVSLVATSYIRDALDTGSRP